MSTYSFQNAAAYWRQVPTATFKIDSQALAARPDVQIMTAWEEGLQDYLKGWGRRGFLPVIERYRAMFEKSRMLEIGCGLGFEHIHFFSPVVTESYLADIVPSNVAVVRKVLEAKQIRQSKALLLDYEKEFAFPAFDFIYSHGVLHHAPFEVCREMILPRFSPHLKQGGTFVVMLYTQKLYDDLKAVSLEDFSRKTENAVAGFSNPWSEPYDAEKVGRLFGEQYCLKNSILFNSGYYAMYELEKLAS